jgi:Tfp pilus assembly protein PilF
MKHLIQIRHGLLAAAFLSLAGCQHTNTPQQSQQTSMLAPQGMGIEKAANLTGAQKADVKVAYGRMMEQRNQEPEALAAYEVALQMDPQHAEACLRMAGLLDRRGRFAESRELYQKALVAKPGNPDIYCKFGYSLYLQKCWAESAMQFRQALALEPGNMRAHNNLGLALAHCGQVAQAMAQFREGGCSSADAHANIAYVMTLERHFDLARQHYELSQRADPASTHAAKGLRELDTLMAKAGSAN